MSQGAPGNEFPREDAGFKPEKIIKAERRIAKYPYDIEAWSVLIRDAQTKKTDEAAKVYERLVTQFPNSGRFWKLYIEQEMKARNYEKVEKLFQRCLIKVLNIDLWRCYLYYIKETKANLPSYREKMAQAYDFALDKIGMDVMSYPIWVEYIAFLKSVEAIGSYAENQRITAVRKVYQRGVVNPMLSIELLWKEYSAFEHSINPIIAKKMQEDRGRDYMNARRVVKEYEVVTKGLNKNAASVPPQNTADEVKQVQLWKNYIQWEKSNPLRTEDTTLITKRVMFTYEQCLLCLGHHPDVWIEAAAYVEQASKLLSEKGADISGKVFADEAAGLYERATTTMLKNCTLLYFAYADFEESRLKLEKVHSIYKRLVEIQEIDPTLPYIQYMRFARRAEGIKAARAVFKMAREDTRTTYQLYVAAALMEYYCSKDSGIALKIFELALKRYGMQAECVKEYISYMSRLNEDNNTRVLFERVLSSGALPTEQSRDIWNKFLEFEANIGDITSIVKVEKRRTQVLGNEADGKETALIIDRYKYLDLFPCTQSEMKSLRYRELFQQPQNVQPSTNADLTKCLPDTQVDRELSKLPGPDVTQMLPFKPKILVRAGADAHLVPGGVFPPPPAAADLLLKLPPPESFIGPFVVIDKLVDHMLNLQMPDEIKAENGTEPRLADPGTQLSIDIALGRKRKIESTPNEDSDDESSLAPPSNDIYRQRQQKKVK